MSKQHQAYEPVGSRDPEAELEDWRQEPVASVESRNKTIALHRKPGFYSTGLLVSIGLNAILLMVIGWQYMRLKMSVSPFVLQMKFNLRLAGYVVHMRTAS